VFFPRNILAIARRTKENLAGWFDIRMNKQNPIDWRRKEVEMLKKRFTVWIFSVLVGGLTCLGSATDSIAGVNINIGTPDLNISIGTPPPVVVHAPPPMVVIPGTYVYMAPDVSVDILFYRGHWYRPHGGHWFSSASYNGPWVHVVPSRVPRAVLELPPGYRRIPPGHQRIPYKQVKGNWQRWEREKHWHQNKDWRAGNRGGHQEVWTENEGRGKHGRKGRD
jgi:hypothetical protein